MKLEVQRKRLLGMRNRLGDNVNNEELRLAAAVWLQTVWRRRRARRIYEQKKKDLRQNILEGYARKIQRAYRLRKQAKLLLQQKLAKQATRSPSRTRQHQASAQSAETTAKGVELSSTSPSRSPKLTTVKTLTRQFSMESD